MRTAIDEVLVNHGRVASRAELVRRVGRVGADDEIRRGRLVAILPRAYVRPWDADDCALHESAALTSVGGDVALSHVTALRRLALPVPADLPLHVTAFQPRHPRGITGRLVVHRTLLPLRAVHFDGLPTVRAEVAALTSWPLLSGPEQRAPLIAAARRGLVSPGLLLELWDQMTWLRGRRQLGQLLTLLAGGCESELELWGYAHVFAVPGLDHAVRQRVVRCAERTYRLDMAYEEERVAVELDGRAYHSGREQWERDIARDLDLATLGWQTVRLSHQRLIGDVEGCRRSVAAVLAARRERPRAAAS
jgi:very-short-patch-repair endonuclease